MIPLRDTIRTRTVPFVTRLLVLANRVPGAARERDQIALYKLAAGVVLFPLTYALAAECDRLAGVFRRAADNRSA